MLQKAASVTPKMLLADLRAVIMAGFYTPSAGLGSAWQIEIAAL